jgi:hypothetical protein
LLGLGRPALFEGRNDGSYVGWSSGGLHDGLVRVDNSTGKNNEKAGQDVCPDWTSGKKKPRGQSRAVLNWQS